MSTSRTLKAHPELWKGPGVLFSLSKTNHQEDITDACTILSGPRLGIAAWEGRWQGDFEFDLHGNRASGIGDISLPTEAFLKDASDLSFEIDLSWNSDSEQEQAYAILAEWLPAALMRTVTSLPDLDTHSVNENRPTLVRQDDWGGDICVLDLPINTLPSTRQRTRPIVMTTRWVRLILTQRGHIALWHTPRLDVWPQANVHWPHNAVPSFTAEHLLKMGTCHISPSDRAKNWFEETLSHEQYFLDAWATEIEFWQDSAFQWLRNDLSLTEVNSIRDDLGLLSSYLTSARWTQRAFSRRSAESGLSRVNPDCAAILSENQAQIDERLRMDRQILSDCFSILSTVHQRVQEDSALQSRRASERMNWLVTVVTGALLVPTLIAGIYGANVVEFSDGAAAPLTELLSFMISGGLISIGLLNAINHRWTTASSAFLFGIAAIILHSSGWPSPLGSIPTGPLLCMVGFIAVALPTQGRRRSRT